MTLFVAAALLGVGFIYTSMSAHFFKWTIDTCDIAGRLVGAGQNSTGKIVNYEVDMDADIGWLEFTISYIDPGVAAAGCFADLTQGDTYPIADYQVDTIAERLYVGQGLQLLPTHVNLLLGQRTGEVGGPGRLLITFYLC